MFDTDHLPQVVNGGLTELWISRAITDEQTIKIYKITKVRDKGVDENRLVNNQLLCGFNVLAYRDMWDGRSVWQTCAVQRVVPGYDGNAGSPLSKAADLVVLDATVHHCDSQTPTGVENSGYLETDGSERTGILTNKQTMWSTPLYCKTKHTSCIQQRCEECVSLPSLRPPGPGSSHRDYQMEYCPQGSRLQPASPTWCPFLWSFWSDNGCQCLQFIQKMRLFFTSQEVSAITQNQLVWALLVFSSVFTYFLNKVLLWNLLILPDLVIQGHLALWATDPVTWLNSSDWDSLTAVQ